MQTIVIIHKLRIFEPMTEPPIKTSAALFRTLERIWRGISAGSMAVTIMLIALPSSASAAEPCPNEQLRAESNVNLATEQPYSIQLSDCRAYELVSPPNTEGFGAPDPSFGGAVPSVQITESGAVFFDSRTAPPESESLGRGRWDEYFRSRRTTAGWSTAALLPSAYGPGNDVLQHVSSDDGSALVETPLTLSSEDVDNPTGNPSHGYDLYLVSEGAPPQLVSHGEVAYTGAEAGNISASAIQPGAPTYANPNLSAVGFVSPASLERPSTSELTPGCYLWDDAGASLSFLTNTEGPESAPGVLEHQNCRLYGVTMDGRAIIEDTSGGGQTGHLYASDGGVKWLTAFTTQLSGETLGGTTFDALSNQANTVYVSSSDKLVPNDDAGIEIYAVDLASSSGLSTNAAPKGAAVRCLSCGHVGSTGATFLGQSADGSHVFFSSSEGLWSWDLATGATLKVAPSHADLTGLIFSHNGKQVAGLSSAPLMSSDSNGSADVYKFSESNGFVPQLITGGASMTNSYAVAAVSDDGSRLLYDRVPGGAVPSVIDEWANGRSTQVSPLGASAPYSVLGVAGPELEDVFFVAHEPLVPADLNSGTQDIYDARVDGGFPAPPGPKDESHTANPISPGAPPYAANLPFATPLLAPLPPDSSHQAAVKKSTTRMQRLARALRACRNDKSRSRRAVCAKRARRELGTIMQGPKKSNQKSGRQ